MLNHERVKANNLNFMGKKGVAEIGNMITEKIMASLDEEEEYFLMQNLKKLLRNYIMRLEFTQEPDYELYVSAVK